MSQVSAELRWFIDASKATELRAVDEWFHAGSPAGGGQDRTDVYGVEPGVTDLGVKERGGKPGVELKVLVDGRLFVAPFGDRIATAQLWSKVSSQELALPAARRTTHKQRWLRKFALHGDTTEEIALGAGWLGEAPLAAAAPEVGCNVEWTRVEITGERLAWSLGLEAFAFGPAAAPLVPTLERVLRRTIDALADRGDGIPPLGPAWRELSYPAWLLEPR